MADYVAMKHIIIGLVAALAGAVSYAYWVVDPSAGQRSPLEKVYNALDDLDQNGVPDLIGVTNNGYRIPFFGFKEDPSAAVQYFPASWMRRLQPDSIIDYEGIEDRVNE